MLSNIEKTNIKMDEKKALVINKQDYVQIPETNVVISKFECFRENVKGEEGYSYDEIHFKLAENGVFMLKPFQFMKHFMNVVDVYTSNGERKLYDANANEISDEETKNIYKNLTERSWSLLNAKFNKVRDEPEYKGFNLESVVGVDLAKNELIKSSAPLEKCVWKSNRYVNLKFNSQGMLIEESEVQEYVPNKNILYYYPKETGRVLVFYSSNGQIVFDCFWPSDTSAPGFGLFVCADISKEK